MRSLARRATRGDEARAAPAGTARLTSTVAREAAAGFTAYELGRGARSSVRGSSGRFSSTRIAAEKPSTERVAAASSRRRTQCCRR